MAAHAQDMGSSSAPPLAVALAVIPSLPRPLLSRLVARAIERMDEIDGDPDFEIAWPEFGIWRMSQPIVNEDDEEDDHSGGNVEDEGESASAEDEGECGDYGDDQRHIRWRYGAFHID